MTKESMEKDIAEAAVLLYEKMEECQKQLEILRNMDPDKAVSEKEWHEICRTPLRNSETMCHLLRNIFPEAENIKHTANHVMFDLYGFQCGMPLSEKYGICIDMKWWKMDNGGPTNWVLSHRMKKYFELVDAGAGWEELLDLRFPVFKDCARRKKAFLWFTRYRWKKTDRKEWEEEFKNMEERYRRNLEEYKTQRAEIKKRLHDMYYRLLPVLSCFSTDFRRFEEYGYTPLKMIMEKEGYDLDCINQ